MPDWLDINNEKYSVFCVLPGIYTDATVITLTRSGTINQKRWIRWYDPLHPLDKETHPVQMPNKQQAVIKQLFVGDYKKRAPVAHWVIDRLVIRGSEGANWIGGGSTNNILNRLLIEEGKTSYVVFDDAKENVLQNSVLRDTPHKANTDYSLIYFSKNEGTRIVNNELYNATASGVQQGPLSLSNQTVYGNEFYVTSDRYTNCNGAFDPKGKCSCTEIGIVLKGPALPDKSFRIEKNIFWGFRPTDTKCGGTGSPGQAIDLGSADNPTSNVLIKDNIIYDSGLGIYLGRYVNNVSVIGNVFYDISGSERGSGTAISNGYGLSTTIANNTIISADYWYRTSHLAKDGLVECNVVINSPRVDSAGFVGEDSPLINNYLYNSRPLVNAKVHSEKIFHSASDSQNQNLCFLTQKHTGPVEICIPYAKASSASPHTDCTTR